MSSVVINYVALSVELHARIPEVDLSSSENFVRILLESIHGDMYKTGEVLDFKLGQLRQLPPSLEYWDQFIRKVWRNVVTDCKLEPQEALVVRFSKPFALME